MTNLKGMPAARRLREKVRALEAQIKVLSEQDAEDSKIRAERDALLAERREWATRFRGLVDGDDDTNVARQALDLLKVTIDARQGPTATPRTQKRSRRSTSSP